MDNSFYDIAVSSVGQNGLQIAQIDSFTNSAPILKSLPMRPANKGMQNVHSKVVSATGADYTDLDGALSDMTANTMLVSTDLSPFGGKMTVGLDEAKIYGGKEKFFADKMPIAMRESSMAMESSVIYNNIRQFAADEGKLVSVGGSGSTNFSILMVNYSDGDNTGLYDPTGFGNGMVFENMAMWGGDVGLIDPTNGKWGYGIISKLYTGLQLGNSRYVSGLVNIDPTNSKLPTALQLSEMVDSAYGEGYIYMHPRMKTIIGATYKLSPLSMTNSETGISTIVDSWDGVPIITSRNFLAGTETTVSL